MKKYIYLIATLFLLGGCTLSMEEWITPEEERGKDELYTVESEYGTITYQFADSVLYVTDNIQEKYIVRVEHDSILYFNGNIPEKYRPYVGMKLATGCSHLLPYGLNHRVISVQDVGGILKVVATKVSTDEVYKHLKYCFDADISTPDFSEISEEELEDYGYQMVIDPETGDTTLMDWNEYDVEKGLRPAGAKRRSLKQYLRRKTRGDDEYEDGGSADKDGVSKNTFVDIFIDTRDIAPVADGIGMAASFKKGLYSKFKDNVMKAHDKMTHGGSLTSPQLVNKELYAGIGLKSIHYSRAHAEEDTDAGYELKYTDSWSEWEFKAEAGFSVKMNNGAFSDFNMAKSYGKPNKDFLQSMMAVDKSWSAQELCKEKTTWDNAKVRIAICATPIPLALLFQATFTPEVSVNGNLSVSATYTSDKVRTGYEVKDGKETKIKDLKIEEGHWSTPQVLLNGSLKLGATFRAAAGIEVAGTFAVTVGANVDAFFEASGTIDMKKTVTDFVDQSEDNFMDNVSGKISFHSDFYGDIQLHVAPLGISLWDKQVAKFFTKHLINISTNYGPSVYFVSGDAKVGYEIFNTPDENDVKISGYYQFKDLGGADAFLTLGTLYPAMKIYFGPISDNKYVWAIPQEDYKNITSLSQWGKAKEGVTYNFSYYGNIEKYKQDDLPVQEVHLVPVLAAGMMDNPYAEYDFADVDAKPFLWYIGFPGMELKDNQCPIELTDPMIRTVEASQIEGTELTDNNPNSHETGGYVSTEKGEQGGMSTMYKPTLRGYTIYTTVKVEGGSRMREWGLKIYIFGPDGKKRLLRRKLPVNKLRSGTYTFIFYFESDWGTKQSIDTKNQHLYFRIQPYWSDPRASGDVEAQDAASLKKYPIDWEMEDTKTDEILGKNNGAKWGTVSQQNLHDY